MTAHSATANCPTLSPFIVPLEHYSELNFLPPISPLGKELDAKLEELGRRFAQQQREEMQFVREIERVPYSGKTPWNQYRPLYVINPGHSREVGLPSAFTPAPFVILGQMERHAFNPKDFFISTVQS